MWVVDKSLVGVMEILWLFAMAVTLTSLIQAMIFRLDDGASSVGMMVDMMESSMSVEVSDGVHALPVVVMVVMVASSRVCWQGATQVPSQCYTKQVSQGWGYCSCQSDNVWLVATLLHVATCYLGSCPVDQRYHGGDDNDVSISSTPLERLMGVGPEKFLLIRRVQQQKLKPREQLYVC